MDKNAMDKIGYIWPSLWNTLAYTIQASGFFAMVFYVSNTTTSQIKNACKYKQNHALLP